MPKNVLYIDNTRDYGGAILSLRNLLRAIDVEKFVPVITTGQPLDYLKREFPSFHVHSLKIKLPWVHNHIYKKVLEFKLAQFLVCRKIITLWRYLYWIIFQHIPDAFRYWRLGKQHRVSLVHLNNILGSQLSGILAAKLLRVPCVAHLRDFERNTFITRFYARMIDHHIAISSAIRDNLLELGIPAQKITVIHDSLDSTEFNPRIDTQQIFNEFRLPPDSVVFGLFGRVVAWKGIREFVEASALVLAESENTWAFVVGSAPEDKDQYLNEIILRIEQLGLQKRIILTGYRSDVPQLMASMDVIVHASISAEPFGMVVIEGMAMGKAVVATDAGGPRDIVVEGETGLLVKPKDITALAQAISRLVTDQPLRSRLGARARQRVENYFSNDRSARKIECLYANVLKETSGKTLTQKVQDPR